MSYAQIYDCSTLTEESKRHLHEMDSQAGFWRQHDHGACVLFDFGPAGTHAYPVEMVIGFLLSSLVANAELKLGKPVRSAVVTVPAYFTANQKSATMDAARIAGVEVLRLLPEPTAAALSLSTKYAPVFEAGPAKKFLVFDLGGGTLDVSVLSVGSGLFDVIAVGGDNRCGGNDIDILLAEYLLTTFQQTNPDSKVSKATPKAWSRLVRAAEAAKRELSWQTVTTVVVESMEHGMDFQTKLTRARLEAIAASFFDRLIPIVEKTLTRVRLTARDIDVILPVGGSSVIPRVRELLVEYFKRDLTLVAHPDEAIAVGAAILAYKLQSGKEAAPETLNSQANVPPAGDPASAAMWMENKIATLKFHDVTAHALGIEVVNNQLSILIPQFSKLPATHKGPYTTVQDFQPSVRIVILEGEDPVASQNQVLGTFVLDKIQLAPAGVPHIEVSFSLDKNGILNAVATDKAASVMKGIVLDNVSWRKMGEGEAKWLQKQAEDLLKKGAASRYITHASRSPKDEI